MTVKQLAKDILYHLLISDIRSPDICAETLSSFGKDSVHIKKLKSFVDAKSVIGFDTGKEYSR